MVGSWENSALPPLEMQTSPRVDSEGLGIGGGVYEDSFSDSVTMHLQPNNPDNPYLITLSALVIAFAATNPNESYDSVISAYVDPIIRFDQAAFDEMCRQQRKESFILSDYYTLEFTPNLLRCFFLGRVYSALQHMGGRNFLRSKSIIYNWRKEKAGSFGSFFVYYKPKSPINVVCRAIEL
jgi:hypothetical protein